jgi:TPR repeat protein
MYEKGKGVKQDDFKAFKFFQKACDLNDGGIVCIFMDARLEWDGFLGF